MAVTTNPGLKPRVSDILVNPDFSPELTLGLSQGLNVISNCFSIKWV